MKLDNEKRKALGFVEQPEPECKARAAPKSSEPVPGIRVRSHEERIPGVRLKSQKPSAKKPDIWSYPLWMRQGAAAVAAMFILCATGTFAWTHLGPPGTAAADEQAMMTASVAEDGKEQVMVTEMDMAGAGNTVEVMQLAMKNVPEQVEEVVEEPVVTDISVKEMTDEGEPEDDEESGIEEPADEESEDGAEYEHDSEDEAQGDEDAEGNESGDGFGEDTEAGAASEDSGDHGEETDGDPETGTAYEGSEGTADEEPEEESIESEEQTLLAIAKVDGMLNVREEPSEDAEVVGMLYKDAGGKILEQKDGWTQIESGDLTGWVQDEHLETVTEEELLESEKAHVEAKVTASSLNVREGPGMEAKILSSVRNGDTVEVVEVQDNGWAEVIYNDSTAYINASYAEVGLSLQTGDTIEAYIEKVAEQKKAKVAKAEENAAEAGLEVTVTEEYVPVDASDLEMLATIIYCEAGNQSHEGKVAVGNVVLNRVGSERFPNDINSVIRAPRQFSPVGSGKYDRMLGSGRIPQSCYDAAQEAMDGISYVGGCLYFKNPKIAGAHSGITIGDHVFW